LLIWIPPSLADSVAVPGCLSRIPKPNFYPSRIPDPGYLIPDPRSLIPDPRSNNSNKRRRGRIVVLPFFVATNFTNYFIFEQLQKKVYPKNCLKNMGWGSGIWIRSPDPGSRGQKGIRSVISDPDMQHSLQQVGQIAHCNFQTGN
jgi:hypothetical protein